MNTNQSTKVSGKIFVGGLALETTQNSLRKFFEKFGEVADCVLMVDKNNNKSRGFGFVTMKDPIKIEEILKTQPHIVDGKAVECKVAVPKENMVQQQQQQQTQMTSTDKTEMQAHMEENSGTYNPRKIFVGGLPPLLKEDDMKAYFSLYGELDECIIMHDKNTGRPRGFGFVLFKNVDAADRVMKEKNNHNLMGKWIDCKRAQPKEVISESTSTNNPTTRINQPKFNNKLDAVPNLNPNQIFSNGMNYKEHYPSSAYFNDPYTMDKGTNQRDYYDRTINNSGYYQQNFPFQNQFGNNIMYMNQNNINIYGFPQQPLYQNTYDNGYGHYAGPYSAENFYSGYPEKNLSIRAESFMPNSIRGANTSQPNFTNFPSKAPQNSFSNITEESINEYLENFKKMKQQSTNKPSNEKEKVSSEVVSKDLPKETNSDDKTIPNGGNNNSDNNSESTKQPESNGTGSNENGNEKNIVNQNEGSSIVSPFVFNDNEPGKKMASASLSYYFDFHPKNAKNFKLNLFDNFPYRFENTDKIKLFNDNEEDNLMYNTAKIIDMKSESEDDSARYQNFFGPHRSNFRNLEREERRRYKPY